mgnify:FL=1|tara:strand:- start:5910 stop:6164 length:255 start_codon:yes stop_codon:yes gene_type:complete
MIKLVEVAVHNEQYNLREIVVNSAHITSIVPDNTMAANNANGRLPEGLHEGQQFSKVSFINGKEIVVVGTPDVVGAKAKKIIHG